MSPDMQFAIVCWAVALLDFVFGWWWVILL